MCLRNEIRTVTWKALVWSSSAFTGCSGTELMWHKWLWEAGQQLTWQPSGGRMLACRYVCQYMNTHSQVTVSRADLWFGQIHCEDQLRELLRSYGYLDIWTMWCLYSWNHVTLVKTPVLICAACANRFILCSVRALWSAQSYPADHPAGQRLLFQLWTELLLRIPFRLC